MRGTSRGFTLLEMALVIFIVGTLSAGAITPLRAQLEARGRRRTAVTLDHAVEALYGFALIHGRLPCPDAAPSGDGREDRLGERACVAAEGSLPHVDLAIDGLDAWGNRLRYRVTAAVVESGTGASSFVAIENGNCRADDADFDLCERGNNEVRTRGNNHASALSEAKFDFELADALPAVVVSHGANGHGATAQDGTARGLIPGRNRDEQENADGDGVFFMRVYAADQPACADDSNELTVLCEFDDMLRWLSPTILSSRMVSAGQLP
jgi:prepilin-type N-terminal cleavage/methylation domain-containing protein